ncbi:MAG: cytochrome c [Burkholderiales bacterium]|jgi:cytochrome c|nr:cytochrome c [Burkholderiales bacterium]
MSSAKFKLFAVSVVGALVLAACASPGGSGGGKTKEGIPLGATGPHPVQPLPDKPRFGQPVTEAQLAAWDIDIRTPDGKGLPAGRGSVAEGQKIYVAKCLACHGENAKGGSVFGAMVGGIGSFKTGARVLTPGSMYPYAPILFDYIRRSMPMDSPQSLSANDVYALSAYILNLNGLIAANAVMDQNSLPKVQMPNRDGFIVDTRPDVQAVRCMSNCK